MKQLSRAKIDLEEILAEKQERLKIKTKELFELPAFCKVKPSPLLFPIVGSKLSEYNSITDDQLGVVGITDTQRLLYWSGRGVGAKELIPNIGPAYNNTLGFDGNRTIYVLIDRGIVEGLLLYTIDLSMLKPKKDVIKLERLDQHHIVYKDNQFYVQLDTSANYKIAIIDCKSGSVKRYSNFERDGYVFTSAKKMYDYKALKKTLDIDYNVFSRINTMYIDRSSRLCLEGKYISIPSAHDNHISLKQAGPVPMASTVMSMAQKTDEKFFQPENKNIYLTQFTWPDGSVFIVDARGFLHMRSSNDQLSEVSLVLIQGKSSACWSSDGAICGNEYFRETIIGMMPVQSFYTRYITPIIQTIINNA
jgi:hypothetical protein